MSAEQSLFSNDNVETVFGQTIDPDIIWLSINQAVSDGFHADVTPWLIEKYLRKTQSADELSDNKQTALDEQIWLGLSCEEVFAKAVLKTLHDAMQDKPDAVEFLILFDLDETLVHRGEFDKSVRLVRPAAIPLMRLLRSLDPRIAIGIVTSRGPNYLQKIVQNPTELAGLLPFMDTKHIYSCRDREVRDYSTKYMSKNNHDIDDLVMDTKRRISVCEEILEASPATSIILVNNYDRGLIA